jgi:hypothetical protein
LIEPSDDEDSMMARIAVILRDPEDEESRQWAYSIVSNQFKDVVATACIAAIKRLTDDERTALFTLAALGSPSYGFWNDWLLRELIKFADQAALPAFEHCATDLYAENAMTQEVISCYTLDPSDLPRRGTPIVEWSLEQWNSLTLTSIFRFAVHDRQDHLISMLAEIGNARSVELLRSYVHDPIPGSSAIRAIEQLTGERSWMSPAKLDTLVQGAELAASRLWG